MNSRESPFNLPYTNQLKQCEEADRKLRYLQQQSQKFDTEITKPENVDTFLQDIKVISEIKGKGLNLLFEDIKTEISE